MKPVPARTLVARIEPALVGALALAFADNSAAAQTHTTRVSVSSSGAQASQDSLYPELSADGRYVVFESAAPELAPPDSNGVYDVFLHDRATSTTTRISTGLGGAETDAYSISASISAGAELVAFVSLASNLVPADTNGVTDVFAFDRLSGVISRISVGPSGGEGDGNSWAPTVSADGNRIAFTSYSTNLVASDSNGEADVFVYDRQSGLTTLASVSSTGQQADDWSFLPSLSADGRYVAFHSQATQLVAGDTNGLWDVFVRDLANGTTRRVSVSSLGAQMFGPAVARGAWAPTLSADGRFVAFGADGSNLVPSDSNASYGGNDAFVHDLWTSSTYRASVASSGVQASGVSDDVTLSADGRVVAFRSHASNLVAGDTNSAPDVFVHDRVTGETELVSLTSSGALPIWGAYQPTLSANGRVVAFVSLSHDMVPGDTNHRSDIFVRELAPLPAPTASIYCTTVANSQGCLPSIQATGVASVSSAASYPVTCTQVLNAKPGLLFYGLAPDRGVFAFGLRCVAPPIRRTAAQFSGGASGPADCSGAYSFDLNAHIQSGVDPALVPGTIVFAQYWSRDPASATRVSLSDAARIPVGP